MALFGRNDVAQAFRNNRQLQQFILTNVTPTGTVLGTGSYGAVEEVSVMLRIAAGQTIYITQVMYQHRACASKRLHEALVDVGNEGVGEVEHRYLQECQLMASLRHPNITQFLGLCFLPGTQLPLLVMERLETSLDDLLEYMPNLPLSLKRSVLEDVASGLLYLHKMQPPVIHRDLTSRNVLLTSSLMAKITDMGNSRIINMRPGQMNRTLTKCPGTLVYMPPEAQADKGSYGPSLDVFSFGHLALYAITQKFPGELLPGTFTNPENDEEILARSELERRGQYIEILESRINSLHPELVVLVKQCLHNVPRGRPTTEELLTRLQEMRIEMEGESGVHAIRLDMVKLRLAKEVKMKTELLTRQQERHTAELEEKDRRVQHLLTKVQQLQAEVQAKEGIEAEMERHLQQMERQMQQLEADIQIQLQAKEAELEARDRRVQQLQEESEVKDSLILKLQNDIAAMNDTTTVSSKQIEKQSLVAATSCVVPIDEHSRVLTLKRSNIVLEEVDIIVNAANGALCHDGGVARAIDLASGGAVQKYSDKKMNSRKGEYKAGSVIVTEAGGELKCKYIIHAIGPTKDHRSPGDSLMSLMSNVLKEAEYLRARSIAIPAISAGSFNVDTNLVAKSILDTILYMFKYPLKSFLVSDVRVVIVNQPTYQSFFNYLLQQKLVPSPFKKHSVKYKEDSHPATSEATISDMTDEDSSAPLEEHHSGREGPQPGRENPISGRWEPPSGRHEPSKGL